MAKKAPVVISQTLISAIWATWNEIGSDCMACSQECGEEINNEGAIEACIDADRLSMHGDEQGKSADAELDALLKEHKYDAVMKALKKQIQLA